MYYLCSVNKGAELQLYTADLRLCFGVWRLFYFAEANFCSGNGFLHHVKRPYNYC